MKKNFFTAAMVMAMMFIASTVMAFEPQAGANQNYGVQTGIYYISVELVKAANGNAPKAMFGPGTWGRYEMKLDGNYYIYTSGKKFLAGAKAEFCFDVGNEKYIPDVISGDSRIKKGDLKSNRDGYPNFYVTPIE